MINTVKRGIIAAMIFIVDLKSLIQDTGQQIDWDVLGPSFRRGAFKVKLAEAVDIGETAVTVDALTASLKKGQEIDFGAETNVTVTVGPAGAIATATSVPVDALTGPIPNGAVIHLGTNKFIKLNAAAVLGAVTLTVLAIPVALVDNDTGTYVGGDAVLKMAADADAGAVTLTVEPPIFALADDAEGYAQLQGSGDAGYHIPAGTVLVREVTSKKMFPRSLAAAEVAEAVLLTDAYSDSNTDSLSGYGVTYGGILYENLMPDAVVATGLLPAAYKTELGSRFVWKVSRDNRGS